MNATVTLGATLIVGGVLYYLFINRRMSNIIALHPRPNKQYPIPAETRRYENPPASEISTLPPVHSACSVSTPDEYNGMAKLMGLPLFTGSLPTNSPDDPATQEFNTLLSGLKTQGGCYGIENQKDTSLSLPSYLGDQSLSYN